MTETGLPGERAGKNAYSPCERRAPPSRPHSSGFKSFLRWFRRVEAAPATGAGLAVTAPGVAPGGEESDSESGGSETSTATAASFAFLAPAGYRPYGDALAPRKYIASGPYTDTYNRLVLERERRRRLDRGVTLRKKYHLHSSGLALDATLTAEPPPSPPLSPEYDTFSLPAMSKSGSGCGSESAGQHRRAASETKFVRPTSYVHVKGKRRAPPPPDGGTLTRRANKKRLAPQPPGPTPQQSTTATSVDISLQGQPPPVDTSHPSSGPPKALAQPSREQNAESLASDLLALQPPGAPTAQCEPSLVREPNQRTENQKHILLHSRSEDSPKRPESGELSPRPWYKRQFSENKAKSKNHNEELKAKSKQEIPEINFFRYSKIFESKKISGKGEEARRVAPHALPNISELDREAAQILLMHKSGSLEENNNDSDGEWQNLANPRSARHLITKFNELHKGNKVNECKGTDAAAGEKCRTSQLPDGHTGGEAPRAAPAGEETWACARCGKRNHPKKIICSSCFFRKPKDEQIDPESVKRELLKSFESEVFDALAHLGDLSQNKLEPNKNVRVVPDRAGVRLKREEDEEKKKLKQILKEMKNSLPKRPIPGTDNNAKSSKPDVVRSDLGKQSKPAAPCGVTPCETPAVGDSGDGAIRTRITSTAQTEIHKVTGELDKLDLVNAAGSSSASNLYANMSTPLGVQPASPSERGDAESLVKELEAAISGGDDAAAAELAKRLARLRVSCTVVPLAGSAAGLRRHSADTVTVEVWVESAECHRGPVPLPVARDVTLAQLRRACEEELRLPAALQRWIVGKQLCLQDELPLAHYNRGDFTLPLFLYLVSPAKVDANLPIPTTNEIVTPANNTDNKPNTPTTSPAGPGAQASSSTDRAEQAASSSSRTENAASSAVQVEQAASSAGPIEQNASPAGGSEAADHYRELMQLETQELIPNAEPFTCAVCLCAVARGAGVVLRECLHTFCRECLAGAVQHCQDAQVECPYGDREYVCRSALQQREIRALVSPREYERHLGRSVALAEHDPAPAAAERTFHCKTADCAGWCVYETTVNHFVCPVCRRTNCLTCQAIHEGENCRQYQEHARRAEEDGEGGEGGQRTRRLLEEMCARGDALACPTCQVLLMKKWGCDWVKCSMCKTEICWVTRGARWGPAGRGDTSAGCRCGLNGVKCHPSCTYCH